MKRSVVIAGFVLASLMSASSLSAQCPMCKTSLESSRKTAKVGPKKVGNGINQGILYLLATPYILAGAAGIFWWKNYKKGGARK